MYGRILKFPSTLFKGWQSPEAEPLAGFQRAAPFGQVRAAARQKEAGQGMEKTTASACIVVYGGGEEAAKAARSLMEHTRGVPLTLTIVDNASPDGAGAYLAAQEFGENVRVVCLPENVGFGSGHNRVLPDLESKYHFVVNPDILLEMTLSVRYARGWTSGRMS